MSGMYVSTLLCSESVNMAFNQMQAYTNNLITYIAIIFAGLFCYSRINIYFENCSSFFSDAERKHFSFCSLQLLCSPCLSVDLVYSLRAQRPLWSYGTPGITFITQTLGHSLQNVFITAQMVCSAIFQKERSFSSLSFPT